MGALRAFLSNKPVIAGANKSQVTYCVLVRASKFGSIFLGLILVVGLASPAHAADTRPIDIVAVNWIGARPFDVSLSEVESSIRNEVGARWKKYTTF